MDRGLLRIFESYPRLTSREFCELIRAGAPLHSDGGAALLRVGCDGCRGVEDFARGPLVLRFHEDRDASGFPQPGLCASRVVTRHHRFDAGRFERRRRELGLDASGKGPYDDESIVRHRLILINVSRVRL